MKLNKTKKKIISLFFAAVMITSVFALFVVPALVAEEGVEEEGVEEEAVEEENDDEPEIPGFGIITAILALLGVVLLLKRSKKK